MIRQSGPIFLVANQELKQYRLNKRLNILPNGIRHGHGGSKIICWDNFIFSGSYLLHRMLAYTIFHPSWQHNRSQVSYKLTKTFPTMILITTQLFDRTKDEEL